MVSDGICAQACVLLPYPPIVVKAGSEKERRLRKEYKPRRERVQPYLVDMPLLKARRKPEVGGVGLMHRTHGTSAGKLKADLLHRNEAFSFWPEGHAMHFHAPNPVFVTVPISMYQR